MAALRAKVIVQSQQAAIFGVSADGSNRTGGTKFRDPFLLPGFSVISGGAFLLPGVTAFFCPDHAENARCSDTARSSSMATGLRRTVETAGAISNSSPLAKSDEPVIMITRQSGFA